MKEEEIRKLVKIVEESNIAELEVSRWGKKVRIIKEHSHSNNNSTQGAQTILVSPAPSETTIPAPAAEQPKAAVPPAPEETPAAPSAGPAGESDKLIEIRSPMVGTFYRAPAPDADPYVQIGDHISPGQVLCIIEAMKLMNEIESEVSGTIVDILVENAQPVEYNQPLFKVRLD